MEKTELAKLYHELSETFNLQPIKSEESNHFFAQDKEREFSYESDLENRIEIASFKKDSKVLISNNPASNIYLFQVQIPNDKYIEELNKVCTNQNEESSEKLHLSSLICRSYLLEHPVIKHEGYSIIKAHVKGEIEGMKYFLERILK